MVRCAEIYKNLWEASERVEVLGGRAVHPERTRKRRAPSHAPYTFALHISSIWMCTPIPSHTLLQQTGE